MGRKPLVTDNVIGTGTRNAAERLGVSVGNLAKAIWLRRVEPPAKGPGGAYLWTTGDLEKAAWALCRRSLADIELERKQREAVKP